MSNLKSAGQSPVLVNSEYYFGLCNPIIKQDSQLRYKTGLSSDLYSFYFENVFSPFENFGIHAVVNYAPIDIKAKTLFGSEYTTHQNTANLRFGLSYSNIITSGIWSLDGGAFLTWANRIDSFTGVNFPQQEVQSVQVGALIQSNLNISHSTLSISAMISQVSIHRFDLSPRAEVAAISPAIYLDPSFSYIYHVQRIPVLSVFFQSQVLYSLKPFEQKVDNITINARNSQFRLRVGFYLRLDKTKV